MSPIKKRRCKLLLTDYAISKLLEIEAYSDEKWGGRTAAQYLKDIESGLELIMTEPGVLQTFEDLPEEFQFYRVRGHLIICDVRPASVVVLTVVHGSMDIPNRLAELAPQLSAEVSLLHHSLVSEA